MGFSICEFQGVSRISGHNKWMKLNEYLVEISDLLSTSSFSPSYKKPLREKLRHTSFDITIDTPMVYCFKQSFKAEHSEDENPLLFLSLFRGT